MTETQKEALRLMDAGNYGAVVTKFGWTWPDHVRRSEEHAAEVVRVLRPKLAEPTPESEAFKAMFAD
jgi:hypothetical protein